MSTSATPAFGTKLRELRHAKGLTLRTLADRVGVSFTYLSKIENVKLESGHAPSEQLIQVLSKELDGNERELMLLANKIPKTIRRRLNERPDAFAVLAELDDANLDKIVRKAKRLGK
ncbi:helix-turn-helix transcriptional regulator [Novipirellula rosea]|uniref:helix-turn-helix domain-containing protein n=1 Tax=Novipirellula rosea TaxID=1031540 RepID=UPI0031EE343C